MKEFFKWLGVNEKVAKVVIWLLIIMVCMIVFNTALDSLGLPYYKITVDNLQKINSHKVLEYLASYLMVLLNFYTIVFMIFRVKEFKKIFPYSILYLIFNIIVYMSLGYLANQIFMILYVLIFCYLYSGKEKKYIIYTISSYVLNAIIQYICYLYKIKNIDYTLTNNLTQILLGIDFFIIMIIIILAKEIYLKKGREINGS